MTTITLDLAASTVRHGDRVAAVTPRAARYLRALALCGDGFLSNRMAGPSADTIQQSIVSPLRTALRAVGVPYSIEHARYRDIEGYYLPAALEVAIVGERAIPRLRDPELISQVLARRAAGGSVRAIAAQLGVGYDTAWKIARRHQAAASSASAIPSAQPVVA